MINAKAIKCHGWMLLLVLASVAAAKINPADPPQGVFFERYYALMLGPVKCGYSMGRFERRGDRIHHHNFTTIKLARAGVNIQTSQQLNTIETLDGKPVSFTTSTLLAGQPMKVRGTIVGNRVHTVTEQGGRELEGSYQIPADAVMPWGEHLLSLKKGLKPGTQYRLNSYNPLAGMGNVLSSQIKVVGPETIDLLGKKVRAIKVVTTITMAGRTITSDAWVDQDGEILATHTQIGPFTLKMLACPRVVALSDLSPAEIFNSVAVPLRSTADIASARTVRYRLRSLNAKSPLPQLPDTGMQKVLSKSAGQTILEVRSGGYDRPAGMAGGRARLGNYLKGGVYLDLNDPLLQKLARQAVAGKQDKLRQIDSLRRLVADKIAVKSFNVGFATASETVRSGEGDCSEHAVLLAALARILKIPSRAVMGLVYSPAANSLVYHMWTEVLVSGRWVDVDAALDQPECDATHIALATSSLTDEQFIEEIFKLIDLIGQVKIDVVEVEP